MWTGGQIGDDVGASWMVASARTVVVVVVALPLIARGAAQAAVLTSQYGAVAAHVGVVVLKERLRAIQLIGIVIVLLAVVLMSVTE